MERIPTLEDARVKVPLLDLNAQYRDIETEVMEAIREVCARQQFILGPRVRSLEEQVAAYSQCRYGIGVSSGTDALLVALMALEIGPGDEVITTPFTFFATAGAVTRLGARPLFADIDPDTYNISPASMADLIAEQCKLQDGKLVNRKTGGVVKAVIPVHLFGQTADMDPIIDLASRYGLMIVEDAAQAIGSEYIGGRRAGSMGNIGCFSFFPTKNLGAFGDGGMCLTNDGELAERLRVLRVHGGKPKYHHAVIGGNFRLDELQAAILLVKFKYLEHWTFCRQENARSYGKAFSLADLIGRVDTPVVPEGYRHVFNQYVLRVERRDELKRYLGDREIVTEIYYPLSLHMQPCFASLGYQPDDCPEAYKAARETLAIPIYPELTKAQNEHVVATIASFYR